MPPDESAEVALHGALSSVSAVATSKLDAGDYSGYLAAFAALREPVDRFFDEVMVMDKDEALRRNRLALLSDLRREMNRVADIAKLAA